ncbi:Lsr2 family protein [Nocardioides sp. JQ2195]|uniref:histone-like nucleoid-structuring protein Lsr2 n=1 Tax=Nocardioides sp. JQ2195 TaxID=2592334 RepID=UPI00143E2D97|nr:Lsr2 family protein [Nocardioides sp. JQ2195]QIX26940.1 Lsr2 family protein [Nocardioides sp. JQ2195]
MAKTTLIQITDDLDGSKHAQEISFAFQGTDYTIDLGKKNLAGLEKALKPYISAATKVPRSSNRTSRSTKPKATNQNLTAVRKWAASNGLEISDRGRIPKAVLEQYSAAQDG